MNGDAVSQNDELRQIGKKVAFQRYFHESLISALGEATRTAVAEACTISGVLPGEQFNIVKLSDDGNGVSLLSYPDLFDEAFPRLRAAWTVDLSLRSFRFRTYENSLNPPILHRKELLLSEQHPARPAFEALTQAAEQLGLFHDPVRIGFLRGWEALLVDRGYRVVGHELVPIGNDEQDIPSVDEISEFGRVARHLTALQRYSPSAPIQTLARFGFLDGSKSVFDYGCGRGDDLRGLQENGIPASGWDPHYAPEQARQSAAIVNLGFVINVIEDLDERIEALRGAYTLAEELLVISAMLANQEAVRGRPYGDGVITSRNTFQKYYSQGELGQFIAEVLDEDPLPVAPGIYFVFRDKQAEQRFRVGRQSNRRNVLRLTLLSRPVRPERIDRAQAKYEEHHAALERLWELALSLGRVPDRSEVSDIEYLVQHFGSVPSALRFVKSRKPNAEGFLTDAQRARSEDLTVYFAQLQFDRRRAYRQLESRLQRDVRTFFGDYREALAQARELLFAAGQVETIASACQSAAEQGIGWLDAGHSLQLHSSLVPQLPPVLRVYVNCGLQLYGDFSSADLIKIHIQSGKLTLMSFDDFLGKPLPRMFRRVKVRLRDLDLDYFEYGDAYEPPYLYRKSRFINEELPNFAEQMQFEDALQRLGLFDFAGYGPPPNEFDSILANARWEIDGFSLTRCRTIPNLDTACGHYFTYRDLIECGETRTRTQLPNIPKQPETYTALCDLCFNLLDPIIEYFGMIDLTYGFCSPELAREIPARIAPKLDQHASHERNRMGRPICDRGGAAVDFLVEYENMSEVAAWIAENLPFDRLYLYGPSRPIHLSYGPELSHQVIEMKKSSSGRLLPLRRTRAVTRMRNTSL
ncbi:DNA phosphorothioation-associated putative methyltransferase [Methylotetracoccus oryzae]|uniref:DNA phosphorothioation-associated putative methyltransferase n=1 Tax=Methylotetracoccus oryzae TaxID=1919059 RepID=UPI001118A185|nr:DNA phosphorothioation-associated putative methyltransferase [Methylotetracoccus oryzae]